MAAHTINSLKYLTISPNDELWGVVTTTVGSQQIAPNACYPAMKHPDTHNFKPSSGRILDEYQIVYIAEGCGFFESQSMPHQRVEAGTAIILYPNEWHNYAPDKEHGWSEYWIGFRGAIAAQLFDSEHFTRNNALLNIGHSNSVISLYREAIRLAEGQNIGCQQLISSIVVHLAGLIHYKYKNRRLGSSYAEEIIDEARQIMREQIDRSLRAEDIAKRLCVGYSWFRQTFKRITGVSPSRYQQMLLISRAKELLMTENQSITDIATTLGFENVGQFSTAFHKAEALTPRQFREENRLK
ncbi:MAG: AraC family transcriptional regulator [Alistipes sp.]|nr:AraC family transcriptional regulator [Alistipes sp.]